MRELNLSMRAKHFKLNSPKKVKHNRTEQNKKRKKKKKKEKCKIKHLFGTTYRVRSRKMCQHKQTDKHHFECRHVLNSFLRFQYQCLQKTFFQFESNTSAWCLQNSSQFEVLLELSASCAVHIVCKYIYKKKK